MGVMDQVERVVAAVVELVACVLSMVLLLFAVVAVVLLVLALLGPSAWASWDEGQEWTYCAPARDIADVHDVVATRIYWSAWATCWTTGDHVEHPVATSCGPDHCNEDSRRQALGLAPDAPVCPDPGRPLFCCGDVPMPEAPLAFFAIVAVDAGGQSSGTGHGAIAPSCP